MYINPAIKRGGIGVLLIATVGIYVEIPELIKEITIRDNEGEILWEISALNQEFGAHSVLYGVLNKKEYIQEVPLSGSPKPLIRNNTYSLELTTVKASYRTSFLFHESKVFLTEKDKVEYRNF